MFVPAGIGCLLIINHAAKLFHDCIARDPARPEIYSIKNFLIVSQQECEGEQRAAPLVGPTSGQEER